MYLKEHYIGQLGGADTIVSLIPAAYLPQEESSTETQVAVYSAGNSPLAVEKWDVALLHELYVLELYQGAEVLKSLKEAASQAIGLRQNTAGAIKKQVASVLPNDIVNAGAIIKHGNTKFCCVGLLGSRTTGFGSRDASPPDQSDSQQDRDAYEGAISHPNVENGHAGNPMGSPLANPEGSSPVSGEAGDGFTSDPEPEKPAAAALLTTAPDCHVSDVTEAMPTSHESTASGTAGGELEKPIVISDTPTTGSGLSDVEAGHAFDEAGREATIDISMETATALPGPGTVTSSALRAAQLKKISSKNYRAGPLRRIMEKSEKANTPAWPLKTDGRLDEIFRELRQKQLKSGGRKMGWSWLMRRAQIRYKYEQRNAKGLVREFEDTKNLY